MCVLSTSSDVCVADGPCFFLNVVTLAPHLWPYCRFKNKFGSPRKQSQVSSLCLVCLGTSKYCVRTKNVFRWPIQGLDWLPVRHEWFQTNQGPSKRTVGRAKLIDFQYFGCRLRKVTTSIVGLNVKFKALLLATIKTIWRWNTWIDMRDNRQLPMIAQNIWATRTDYCSTINTG